MGQARTVPDAEESPVGRIGVLTIASRGAGGPGEVRLAIRGGSELYAAWTSEPLARGTSVLVIHSRGAREVDVEAWGGTLVLTDEPVA